VPQFVPSLTPPFAPSFSSNSSFFAKARVEPFISINQKINYIRYNSPQGIVSKRETKSLTTIEPQTELQNP